MQRAVQFVTRCQNNSETNDQKWAGNDGGFIVTAPAMIDPAKAWPANRAMKVGRPRFKSMGTMSYAGLRDVYAGEEGRSASKPHGCG